MWMTIPSTEYQTGNLIDSEFLAKIRGNLNHAIAFGSLRRQIVNYSFELTTGTLPKYWAVTTDGGCDVAISSGCHGNKAIKMTKAAGTGGAEVWTDYYMPTMAQNLTFDNFWVWASSTGVVGGIALNAYDANYNLVSTFSTLHSSYAATPSTSRLVAAWTLGTSIKFIKVGMRFSTVSTVAGDLYFDAIKIAIW